MANSNGGNINQWTGQPYSEKRKNLAVWQHRDEFLNAFRANQVLALVAQTGSGKSTQIPQFVLDDITSSDVCSKMMIACTQPQKVAVMSVSHRVAEEMGVTIGEEVGYKIKFEDCTSSRTVLKYIKDDMLLKEAMIDPLLQCYKVIIIDDIQERTLSTDLLLGYLSQLLTKRPDDLKLVFMTSTSLESEKFKSFFQQHYPSIHIMKLPERLHPVEIVYSTHEELERNNYLDAVIKTVVNIHRHEPHGDVLVLLSEEEEVEDVCQKISKEFSKLGDLVGPMKLVPLYSYLPATMQHKIHEETCSGRKIVVTTDIVESSLTIHGISYVVDSGFVKKKVFDPKLHIESLVMSPISKASADMRSEHAGRSTSDRRKGKCFRLYTEESYNNNLDLETCPEILRLNLANMILSLWKLDVDDFWSFGYVDFPDVDSLVCAFATLVNLGALDQECKLTNIGEIMSMFPLEPQMSKMLVVSPQFNCSEEILSISSMLSVPNCFVGYREEQKEVKAKFHNIHGDHLTLLNIYNAYKQNNEDLSWCNDNFINYWALKEADNIRQELASIMMTRLKLNKCSTDDNNSINIRKSILAGYFMNMAHLDTTGNYITLEGNKVVNFNPSSNDLDGHKPKWVIFNALDATNYNFIHTITTIHCDWLVDSEAPWSMYYELSKFSNSEAKSILERLRAYASYARMLKERKLADGKLGKHANISTFHRLLPYQNNRKRKQRI
ncbi:probable pre-mRNA-splicing factor ATP-dependent RNA helicase DEAH3 [Trifolium pratense]|uniref:probable pre-mRNA-splicing factor ATP-dependent RNA helicase DEAH3 n=1 Tax=Trifolium pratense TaxID=57577 RepID=UPI001E690483|nr:probable pre-mRNA-splicing factor ATP-dependent RNA helicase DEAH3 [Trifolium pratense]